ncbi:MAG TPA: fibronectin type III domain-containing protein [Gemmatimonadales bacterium]|nr:fibronectin type III domain-containing protein [Gemmatimonadales bacterium]
MKVTPRFMIRAGLAITAAGVIGAIGACKNNNTVAPPPPPPPPPLAAPTSLTATSVGTNKINVTWQYTDTTIAGFRLDRCSGASCANFTQLGTNLAANLRAFSDTGLAPTTAYSYRIRAFKAADTSAWSTTATATTGAAGSGSFSLVGAGEISTGLSSAGPTATAKLVNDMLTADPQAVAFTIGNNLVDSGGTFPNSPFDKTWGPFKSKAYISLGNGDFEAGGPSSVYGYFGANTAAGASMVADKGWFSFDKGSWHIVVLNTSDWEHGKGATFGTQFDQTTNSMILVPSEQVDWLTADLAAARKNGAKCIAVISWERRFYTTGTGALGRQANMLPMGSIMYQNGVDLLISAKDKLYERFAPMNPSDGSADPKGFRQFIVGTGGRSADQLPAGTVATREVALSLPPTEWGVLKLTLNADSYDYQFVNTNPASTNVDKSTASVPCHQ